MVLFPLALNLAQAWVQDTHLKASRDTGAGGTPRHGRTGSRASSLEAVLEERGSLDGGSRLSGSHAEAGAKAAADGAASGDDREALLTPYRGDS